MAQKLEIILQGALTVTGLHMGQKLRAFVLWITISCRFKCEHHMCGKHSKHYCSVCLGPEEVASVDKKYGWKPARKCSGKTLCIKEAAR